MTQFFTYSGFSLRRAPLPVRLLLTLFLLLSSIGVTVGVVNYQVRTGLTAQGSGAWYRRGVAASEDDRDPQDRSAGKTPLELLDATHPHLFNQAFLFFVLGHVLALCAIAPGVKVGVYLAGFVAVLVDTASPWLIRYAGPGWAWPQLGGHGLMAVAFLCMVVFPMREMWLRSRSLSRR